MKGPPHLLPVAFFALMTLFILLPLTHFENLPSESPLPTAAPLQKATPLRECGHIILVSAPRHGSTWFLDSAEGCPSSDTKSANYKELIANTELWTTHEGPVYDINPSDAAKYVRDNCSVKLFPTLKRRGAERVQSLFKHVKENHVPVFLLRRNPEGSYASLEHAKKTGVWAKNNIYRSADHSFVWDDEFDEYRQMLDSYFEDVKNLLREEGLSWDEFDYDRIREARQINGIRNQCFIKNCNFV